MPYYDMPFPYLCFIFFYHFYHFDVNRLIYSLLSGDRSDSRNVFLTKNRSKTPNFNIIRAQSNLDEYRYCTIIEWHKELVTVLD